MKHIDDFRVECFARLRLQPLHYFFDGNRTAILTVRGQCIQEINRRKNSGADGNLCALEAEGVSGAVPFFVVGAHDGNHRVGKTDAFENLRPHYWVDLHFFKFFGSQAAGLGDDVLRYSQLADIMKKGSSVQGFEFFGADLHLLGNFDGIHTYALQVVVGGVVFGFNGQRQSLDGAQVETRHLFPCRFLSSSLLK